MISEIVVEAGREREYTITLTRVDPITGAVVTIPAESIDSVTLNISGVACLSTVDNSLVFAEDKRSVSSKLGLVEGLAEWASYECWLTVYDAGAPTSGLPWSRFVMRTVPWDGCSA